VVIQFSKPSVTGDENKYIQQAIASGQLYGGGSFTKGSSDCIGHLKVCGIQATSHYKFFYLPVFGRMNGRRSSDISRTEKLSRLLERLPLHEHLIEQDVILAVKELTDAG
jgi:dTDP-4-amino-4,6-dideoxygalactose transaminase